jgi:hypothetical protein
LSLTSREEPQLTMSESRALKKIIGPKRGNRPNRRQEKMSFVSLYSSSCIIKAIKSRSIKCHGHVARMGDVRNSCIILVGKK